jgi:hypothetical protein
MFCVKLKKMPTFVTKLPSYSPVNLTIKITNSCVILARQCEYNGSLLVSSVGKTYSCEGWRLPIL